MEEFEKQVQKILEDKSSNIPIALLFVGLTIGIFNIFKESMKNIMKGIKEND